MNVCFVHAGGTCVLNSGNLKNWKFKPKMDEYRKYGEEGHKRPLLNPDLEQFTYSYFRWENGGETLKKLREGDYLVFHETIQTPSKKARYIIAYIAICEMVELLGLQKRGLLRAEPYYGNSFAKRAWEREGGYLGAEMLVGNKNRSRVLKVPIEMTWKMLWKLGIVIGEMGKQSELQCVNARMQCPILLSRGGVRLLKLLDGC